MNKPTYPDLYSGTATASNWGEASKPLTMDDVSKAIQLLADRTPAPAMPELHQLPWPTVQARCHNKNRINKKYLKLYGTKTDVSIDKGQIYKMESPIIDFTGRKMFASKPIVVAYPITFQKMIEMVKEK